MFFALSGFLVTGSALRTRNITTFLAFRSLRIFPALAVEVTLSALILGTIFTTLDLRSYFTPVELLRYFGNIFGIVYFYLPGVFKQSSAPGIVNNSLWTLPSEFYCYLITTILMFTKIVYDRKSFTVLFGVITLGVVVASFFWDMTPKRCNMPMWVIIYYFFCGVFFFHWREKVPVTTVLTVIAALATYAFMYFRLPLVVVPAFLTYFTVSLGVLNVPKIPILAKNDYSYGIYLYGFPITQAVRECLSVQDHSQVFLRTIALAVTVGFACASWHFLERRALSQKRRFVKVKRQLGSHL